MQPDQQRQTHKIKTQTSVLVLLVLVMIAGLVFYKHSASNNRISGSPQSSNKPQPTVTSGPYAGAKLYKLEIKGHKLISPKEPIVAKQGQPILMQITSNSQNQENFFVSGQGGLLVEVEPNDDLSQAFFTPTKLGSYSFGLAQTKAPYANFELGQLTVVGQ